MTDIVFFWSNFISFMVLNNLDLQFVFYKVITEESIFDFELFGYSLSLWSYGFCFLALFILPFLHKKFQNIIWWILIFLLIWSYFWIILCLVIFDLFLYYSADYISKKYNLKIKEIKNISAFQYFAKFFPFVWFLSFFRLWLSNKLEIKKLFKISFLSSLYSFIIIWYTYFIVFWIGEKLNSIYNTRNYETLIVSWQFIVVWVYAMMMYYFMRNKEEK